MSQQLSTEEIRHLKAVVDGTGEVALVSKQMLRKLLATSDSSTRRQIDQIAKSAATTGNDGVLAQDCRTGRFKVLKQNDLEALLQPERSARSQHYVAPSRSQVPPGGPRVKSPEGSMTRGRAIPTTVAEELELINTQMLQQILVDNDGGKSEAAGVMPAKADPYNSAGGPSVKKSLWRD